MDQLIIFVGDVTNSVHLAAKKSSEHAFLIDRSNYTDIINKKVTAGVVYTSLGDLPQDLSQVFKLLSCADTLIYCNPDGWSDNKLVDINNMYSGIQSMTEAVLFYFLTTKNNVKNLNFEKYRPERFTTLSDSRKNNNPQLWIAGCSISHGIGIGTNQRYGQLLADELNLAVSFLTAGGSSIEWQADQILRSDIKTGDLVIWGLTGENRFPLWSNKDRVRHITGTWTKHMSADVFDLPESTINSLLVSNHQFYQALIHVNQVVNFCNKLNIKLLIFSILSSSQLNLYLSNTVKNFAQYYYPSPLNHSSYIDIGNDNEHPGPKQHKFYSQFCLEQLKKFNYI